MTVDFDQNAFKRPTRPILPRKMSDTSSMIESPTKNSGSESKVSSSSSESIEGPNISPGLSQKNKRLSQIDEQLSDASRSLTKKTGGSESVGGTDEDVGSKSLASGLTGKPLLHMRLEGIQESEENSERQSDVNMNDDLVIDINLPSRHSKTTTPQLSQQNSFTLKMNQSIKEEECKEGHSEEN